MISICFTLGTRPEAIKLAPVIRTFQASSKFTTQVVLTGQHREMVAQVMDLAYACKVVVRDLVGSRFHVSEIEVAAIRPVRGFASELRSERACPDL